MKRGDKIFLIVIGSLMILHMMGLGMNMTHSIDYRVDSTQFVTMSLVLVGIPYLIYKIWQYKQSKKITV